MSTVNPGPEESREVRLVTFRVQSYKNFIDSGEVEIDDEATVLVGKNEAGKSTLLDALWRLKPANEPPRPFNFVLDYPRWQKKEHEGDGTAGALPPIWADFTLSGSQSKRLEQEFGAGILASSSFSATRDYGDTLVVKADIETAAWARAFAESHPTIWAQPADVTSVAALLAHLGEQRARVDQVAEESEDADHAAADEELEEGSIREELSVATEELGDTTDQSIEDEVSDALKALVPKFFYFDDVFLLPGSVSIDRIREAVVSGDESDLTDEEVAASRFLRSVRLDPENLDPENYEALRAELEAVGNLLTDRVQKFWQQNPHLEFKVEPENIEEPHPQGGAMRIVDRRLHFRVNDRRHRVTTSFSTRSTGFRWFVSFLAQFSYYAEGKRDVVVLLDEPGVALHAKAQADLLDYFDAELVPHQQLVYTTHSAWMVPVRKIHRVRTVEEDLAPEISSGATVSGKMLAKDRDTLMPLQAALGYDVAQTLFIGPDSLVVEGISEVLYLYDMSDLLLSEKRTGLDQRWHVCPAGSVSRVPAMLGLIGNSVDTTVLIDSPANPTERGHIEDRLYDNARLIEISNVTGKPDGDIEDLISTDDYLIVFNDCFETTYTAKAIKSKAPRITKRLEEDHGKFNHGEVARTWVRGRAAGDFVPSAETMDSFETLFEMINATLVAPGKSAPSANRAAAIFDKQLADGLITTEQHEEIMRQIAAD